MCAMSKVMKLWQRRVLGILAVGGGAIGFTVGVTALIGSTRVIEWVMCLAFCVLYAWGIWCGIRLLERQPDAEMLNRRFWLSQIPALKTPLFGYIMACGFHLTVSLDFTPFKLGAKFDLGSNFNFSLIQWDSRYHSESTYSRWVFSSG